MDKNNKKVISLTEDELHSLVLECVSQIVLVDNKLNEGFWDALKGAANKIGGDVRQVGNNIKQGVQQGVQNVKNYANDVRQAGVNASNNADIQRTIKTIQDMLGRGLVNQRAANMVIGSLRKYMVNQ